jgi:hypothetical protein
MYVTINCAELQYYLESFISKDSQFINLVIEIIRKLRNFDINKRIEKIFYNLFLDDYRELFFSYKMDNLFIHNHEKFKKHFTAPFEVFPKEIYTNLLDLLFNLDVTYETLLKTKKYIPEEIPLSKG